MRVRVRAVARRDGWGVCDVRGESVELEAVLWHTAALARTLSDNPALWSGRIIREDKKDFIGSDGQLIVRLCISVRHCLGCHLQETQKCVRVSVCLSLSVCLSVCL